jgi:hypothetical protein
VAVDVDMGVKTNEWNLLKHQFDALVHGECVDGDSIEKVFDAQIRRRFAELINRIAEPPKPKRIRAIAKDLKR